MFCIVHEIMAVSWMTGHRRERDSLPHDGAAAGIAGVESQNVSTLSESMTHWASWLMVLTSVPWIKPRL